MRRSYDILGRSPDAAPVPHPQVFQTPSGPTGVAAAVLALQRLVGNRQVSRWLIQRDSIGERNVAANPGCRPRTPESCATYEAWISTFRNLPFFVANDESVGEEPGARSRGVGWQLRTGRQFPAQTGQYVLGDSPAPQQAPSNWRRLPAPRIADRFIDHPTDEWVRNNLPAELRATAYQMPADCADVAVILRHVWLFAHGRSEQYRGWVVGRVRGERERTRLSRIDRLRHELDTPDIHQMVNAYTGSDGRPLRSFEALQRVLHPGDILVWAHHNDRTHPRRRTGGHTQTVLDIVREGESVTTIFVLQGNQPISPSQAESIQRQHRLRGLTSALRFRGGSRIEVGHLSANEQLAYNRLQDTGPPGERVWTWPDGTTPVAAGPAASAVRRRARRRGRPLLGSATFALN